MLTASADTGSKFVGTEKGDVFKADSFVSATGTYLPTLNSSDELDGGAGKDTLNITSDNAYTMADATIKNIETITIKGADNVTADVSGSNITGLETISVLKSTAAAVHANSTTDVNVSGAKGTINVSGGNDVVVTDATAGNAITVGSSSTVTGVTTETNATGTITITDTDNLGANVITVNGGTDVTVTATATTSTAGAITTGAIAIGAAKAATGDVKVTQNLNSDGTAAVTAGTITVTGGKTVDVTVNSTIIAKDAGAKSNITNGNVTVNSDGKTTDVTVKQNSTVDEFVITPETALVNGKTAITFKEMTAGDILHIDGLNFHATKNLTAAEVAAAFANLTADDTQSATGITANGYYTGALQTTDLTTGAANGAVVEFISATAVAENFTVTDLALGALPVVGALKIVGYKDVAGTLTDVTLIEPTAGIKTNGTALVATEVKTGNKVNYGDVTVNEKAGVPASITTVTLDGFKDAKLGTSAAPAAALNALTTLNIANSAATTTLKTTKTSLTLNVDNIIDSSSFNAAAVDLDNGAAAITTLTINATGEDSKFALTATKVETLTIAAAADLNISKAAATGLAALKTVTISGTGDVTLGDISAKLETLTASAATGDISATVAGTATVTTGAGNDSIIVNTNAISKAINLGAGDDKITLASGTVTANVVATIDGGTGSNTLAMTAADAVTASSAITFETKITNFDKLSINNTPTAVGTVDLANMDDISYVISANSGSVATKEVFTANFNTSGTIVGTDTISFDGSGNINLTAGMTATQIADAVAAGTYTTYDVTNNSDGTVTFTAKNAGVIAPDVAAGNFVITDTDDTTAAATIAVTTEGTVTYTFDTTGLKLNLDGTADTFAIGGYTYTALANGDGLSQIATAINNGGAGTTIDGIIYTATASGANLVLTTSNATPLASLTYTATNLGGDANDFNAGSGSGTPVAKLNAATEVFTADFTTSDAIEDGDTIVFDGKTITLATGMSAEQIATAVAGQAYTNYTASNLGLGVVRFTQNAAGVQDTVTAGTVGTDMVITNNTSITTKAAVAVNVTTQGAAAGTTPSLTLDNMANNGTLELTKAGNGVIVKMKDASGKTDTFNIVTGDEALNVGTVVVNSVETINVTTTDIFTDDGLKGAVLGSIADDGKDDFNSSSTLVVSADAAKTVNVSGAGDLILNTTSVVLTKVLTKVDANAMTGDLFYIADGATAGTEVIAGSGNDTLIADGENDVLKGGAGDDTFYAGNLTTVYGGAGADTFYFATPTQLSKVSTIADLGSGDTIYLYDNEATDSNGDAIDDLIVNKFFAAGAQYNVNTTTTFESKVNASLTQTGAGEATWFQHGKNTYIVIDNETGAGDPAAGAVDTYTAGKDVVIEITGLVDLSTASFNTTTGTLEIA